MLRNREDTVKQKRQVRWWRWLIGAAALGFLVAALAVAAVVWIGVHPVSSYTVPLLTSIGQEPWKPLDKTRPPYLLDARDREALERARQNIEARGQRQTTVTLQTREGQPLPGGRAVKYRLVNHEFGFGNFDNPAPQLDALWGPHKNLAYLIQTWRKT